MVLSSMALNLVIQLCGLSYSPMESRATAFPMNWRLSMKVGDLVRSTVSVLGCQAGIVIKFYREGAMILWEHGETCWSPSDELEVVNESR